MAKHPADPPRFEACLAPPARIARKHREIEGLVFWGGPDGWDDRPSEALEAEEIALYAEGLLLDGFHMDWALVTETGDQASFLRLSFWQEGNPPSAVSKDFPVLAHGRWLSDETAP